MSDTQLLTIALASLPTVLAVLMGILINNVRLNDLNARLGDFRADIDSRFRTVNQRFDEVDRGFNNVDRRFDEMKEVWRSELRRVEEVIDARLKHLEER